MSLAAAFYVGRHGYTWRQAKAAAVWRWELGFVCAELSRVALESGEASGTTTIGEQLTYRFPVATTTATQELVH
jgi:hypothetical protein